MGNMCAIKENNKLIAEFMGSKMIVENHHGINIIEFEDKKQFDLLGLKYHSSWDWLMPVIDGILNASLPLTTDNPINQKRIEIFKNVNLYSSIDKVYNACVEFIKWYNK